jgi:hypothetical protein
LILKKIITISNPNDKTTPGKTYNKFFNSGILFKSSKKIGEQRKKYPITKPAFEKNELA